MPHHNPLTSISLPGLVKFSPVEKRESKVLSDSQFLFEDEKIAIAVGKGILYTDGNNIVMFVASATVSPSSDEDSLQKMKQDLETKISQIRASGNQEEMEKAYLNLQKLTADLKLLKIKKHNHKNQTSQ